MSTGNQEKFRFKIIVCGDWAVGKTSLIKRYSTNTFTNDYLTTIAVNIVTKEAVIDGFFVELMMWDTGGQERFSHLRKRYYKGAQGVIYAFDVTRPETFRAIEKRWIPEVTEVIEDYIPTIWATKVDLVDQRVVSTTSGDRLARRLNAYFFETSSLTGKNVEKAFTSLSRQVLSKALTSSSKKTSFTT
ncbi:MAG: Rab family GTPase [Candidatus Hodarchaeota archaeon]